MAQRITPRDILPDLYMYSKPDPLAPGLFGNYKDIAVAPECTVPASASARIQTREVVTPFLVLI